MKAASRGAGGGCGRSPARDRHFDVAPVGCAVACLLAVCFALDGCVANPGDSILTLCSDGECLPPPHALAESDDRTLLRRERIANVTRMIDAAIDWAGTIETHPIRLRQEKRMKGIKHFVEYLDLLHLGYQWGRFDSALASKALGLAREALKIVDEDEYHAQIIVKDMARFKEDNLSYLRACWLAERFGVDTSRYKREIAAILPHIHSHLPLRGIDQRMGFALTLGWLGFPIVESVDQVLAKDSIIVKRNPFVWYLRDIKRPYDLTHEVFAVTERGMRSGRVGKDSASDELLNPPGYPPWPLLDRAQKNHFTAKEDEDFAIELVRKLLRDQMHRNQLDIAAELLTNLAQLDGLENDLANRAWQFIARRRNSDGSFGSYKGMAAANRILKANPLYDIDVGGTLHTTFVCLWALAVAV